MGSDILKTAAAAAAGLAAGLWSGSGVLGGAVGIGLMAVLWAAGVRPTPPRGPEDSEGPPAPGDFAYVYLLAIERNDTAKVVRLRKHAAADPKLAAVAMDVHSALRNLDEAFLRGAGRGGKV